MPQADFTHEQLISFLYSQAQTQNTNGFTVQEIAKIANRSERWVRDRIRGMSEQSVSLNGKQVTLSRVGQRQLQRIDGTKYPCPVYSIVEV